MKNLIFISLLIVTCNLSFAQTNRLTPEKLWQLERLSDEQVSPDGKHVLYGVTKYELEVNTGERDLFIIPVEGEEAINAQDYFLIKTKEQRESNILMA
ncbi:MAG: hypothetical protein ACOC3T_05820 [Bacteroidota bacterium]